MNRLFGLILPPLSVLLSGCLESVDGSQWQSIFNGRDLSGWTVKCKPADASRTFFRVDNGCILADSMGCKEHDYVWLTTDREYEDFALRLRFQAFRDSPGNSGIQIRSRYDDEAGWLDGPQIDINPPAPWRTGMIWDETRGVQRWISPDVPRGQWVDESMVATELVWRYADEGGGWNDLAVSASGLNLHAVLNRMHITDYDGSGVLDDAVHSERNVGRRGVIALQIHTKDELRIRFKDIRIRDLSVPPPEPEP